MLAVLIGMDLLVDSFVMIGAVSHIHWRYTMSAPRLILFAGLLAINGAAQAEPEIDLHPMMTSRFELHVGGFFPDRRMQLGVNGSTGKVNSLIDVNEALQVKATDTTYSIDFSWRIGERWRLLAQHFVSGGGATHTLERDIPWKDVTFPSGSDVSAGSDFSLISVSIGREFETRDRHELGLGAGLHFIDIGAHITGSTVDDNGVSAVRSEAVSVSGPLPNIGAWYRYSLTPRWGFRSRLDWLQADVGKYDGKVISLSLGLNYRLSKNVGIGFEYTEFELDAGVKDSGWRGYTYHRYGGFTANITVFW